MSDYHLTDEEIDKVAAESFKGFDYSEVFDYLDIPHDQYVEGEDIEVSDAREWKKLRDLIELAGAECCDISWEGCKETLSPQSKKTLLACRAYMRAVAKTERPLTFTHPVWVGLDKVRNDWEFLQLFSLLFPYIWE